MGSTGTNISGSTTQSTTPAFRRVNAKAVSDWVATADPGNFLLDNAPATINVGGVEFNWFESHQMSYGDQYVNSYQSAEQASNGEYPVIEVVVNRVRVRGGTYRYKFNTSVSGTGLK